MTFQHIADLTHGRIIGKPVPAVRLSHVLIDSRQISSPNDGIFIALVGERHDGHEYLEDVYKSGVRHFIISGEMDTTSFPDAGFILVENTLDALQQIAIDHRNKFDLTCIGITGSNGKTIIKEWLFQLLHTDKKIVRSPRSYNSQVGVPLSVLQTESRHELAIFEAGISTTGEMKRLAPIIRPDIGVFSNIGQAHAEGFANITQKIEEKLDLFTESDLIIFCADHQLIDEVVRQKLPGIKTFTWSKDQAADLQIIAIQKRDNYTRITARQKDDQDSFDFQIPFTDDASIENALHCLTCLLVMGYDPPFITERMSNLEQVAMRLEVKEGINNCLLINDSYNSDIKSLSIALDFLDLQKGHSGKTLILSDILQAKEQPSELYQRVAFLLNERDLKRLIGIGKEIEVIRTYLPSRINTWFYPDTHSFLKAGWEKNFRDEIILIKGARRFGFESISEAFSRQVHNARLEIDLNAIVHNLNTYRAYLRPDTRIMVMVKAFAYGAGIEIAKILEFNQVDYLAVANTDEGIQLRQAGIRIPIMILNADPGTIDLMQRYRLEPEVFSVNQLSHLLKNLSGQSRQIDIHIKCDSGMHRLGFTHDDLEALVGLLKSYPMVRIRSVFSHLASSEMPEDDQFSNHQAAYFTDFAEKLHTDLKEPFFMHLVNSAGIHRFPQFHYDMVRLGLGLYGVDPSGEIQSVLRTVLRWTASVQQIKQLDKGQTVGYNRNGPVDKPSRIATINVGYADGLPRLAGNGRATVFIHGKLAATIGNVCMDMTMIDVTHIPNVREGDEVIIFGPEHPVAQLAEAGMTIPYEIFSRIPARIKRVYFQE